MNFALGVHPMSCRQASVGCMPAACQLQDSHRIALHGLWVRYTLVYHGLDVLALCIHCVGLTCMPGSSYAYCVCAVAVHEPYASCKRSMHWMCIVPVAPGGI